MLTVVPVLFATGCSDTTAQNPYRAGVVNSTTSSAKTSTADNNSSVELQYNYEKERNAKLRQAAKEAIAQKQYNAQRTTNCVKRDAPTPILVRARKASGAP